MPHRQVFLLVNLVNWGGVVLTWILGLLLLPLMVPLLVVGILWMSLLMATPFLDLQKRLALAYFGSRDGQDLPAHVAELFSASLFSGLVSVQLDTKDEGQLTQFAESLPKMYRTDTLAAARVYYPDLSEPELDEVLRTVADLMRETMKAVFFPDPGLRLMEKYPYMDAGLIRKLLAWWRAFKSKMEWQNHADGTGG